MDAIDVKDDDVPVSVLLSLMHLTPEILKAMSRKFRKPLNNLNDILTKLPYHFYAKYGKVGILIPDENGQALKQVRDSRYFKDEKYRNYIDKNNYTQMFLLKKKQADYDPVGIKENVKGLTTKYGVSKFKTAAVVLFVAKLAVIPIITKPVLGLIKTSIYRSISEGRPDSHIQQSVNEGLRQSFLDNILVSHKGAYSRLTTTSAEVPEETHLHLEWIVMRLGEAIKHLGRYGCQHDIELMTFNDYKNQRILTS